MHDEVGVRVRDGGQHVAEEAHAGVEAEAPAVAVGGDVLAVDVLEHQVGLARGGDTRVDQVGDVGMAQARQDAALAPEPVLGVPAR